MRIRRRSPSSVTSTPTAKVAPRVGTFSSPHAVPPDDLMGWVGLSMATEFPQRTGNAFLDEHNETVQCVQAYLNGRAISAETDEETAYLLRLRADLNFLLVRTAHAPDDVLPDDDEPHDDEPDDQPTADGDVDIADASR